MPRRGSDGGISGWTVQSRLPGDRRPTARAVLEVPPLAVEDHEAFKSHGMVENPTYVTVGAGFIFECRSMSAGGEVIETGSRRQGHSVEG